MTEDLAWVPPGVDTEKPSIARVYDYWLGGTHNFMADRDAARAVIAFEPNTRAIMRANRGFLARAVRLMVGAGVRQFLDIGSGIPTEGNVHEVAHEAAPDSRVVYVNIDPVAVAHSKAILRDNPGAEVIEADVRDPEKILGDAAVRRLIDFREPVGLLLLAVLHFVSDAERPGGLVATFRDAIPADSYVAMSHASTEGLPEETAKAFQSGYNRAVSNRGVLRPKPEVEALFEGLELLDPGVVAVSQWRPTSAEDAAAPGVWWLGGVGVKA